MSANSKIENLKLLMERPTEPVFVPKGNRKASFEVPDNYLTNRYKPLGVSLTSRFGDEANEKIPVRKIKLPNTSRLENLGRREPFSLFIPEHRELAALCIDIMMGMKNLDDLTSLCCYIRDRINPFLFNYAISVAMLHRPDTQGTDLPNFASTFPEKYLDGAVFARAREEVTIVQDGARVSLIFLNKFVSLVTDFYFTGGN